MRGWDFVRDGAGATTPRTGCTADASKAGPAVLNSTILAGGSAATEVEPSCEPTSAFASTGAEVIGRGVEVSHEAPVAATPLDQVSEQVLARMCGI